MNVEAPDLGFFLLRDRALQWLGGSTSTSTRQKTEATHKQIHVGDTDLKALVEKKVWFYIALYPVRWTAQSALHFPPLADLFIPTPFSASLGSILAMQQLRNDYSLTFHQGEIIKQLQAELRNIKLSTSLVPVSTPSRLCWTCSSPQHFQRNCPHFTGQSFGPPRWNGPFGQTGPPRHPCPMQDTHLNN